MSLDRPRIILADEQVMLCEMVARILQPEFEVVRAVQDGRSLILAANLAPHVVVADVYLPGIGGIEAMRSVLDGSPSTKVIILTMVDDLAIVDEALRAGASGYLLKTAALEELPFAIREVLRDKVYITPAIASKLAERQPGVQAGALTPREQQVLGLLVAGKAMREAAVILELTPRTIAFHKYRIMKKLGVRSNADLIRVALSRSGRR